MNNLGDVQLRLFPKPDGGNIGELLRIDQQWVMYGPDVVPHTEFDLLMGEIKYSYNDKSNTELKTKKIVLNDLLTSNWKSVTIFEGIKKYKRPFNPTNINPSMRWERLFVKIGGYTTKMMDSVLFWFCKHTNNRELILKYQNHSNKFDNGIPLKTEIVYIHKMTRAGWCRFQGEIIDLWKQNKTIKLPQYKNEKLRCYHQISYPI